ncbi:putative nuclease HARBI1 [Saccostrea echinata]|uniref:putative nuclease HARBI1 n=2 Tax=Saccostrea echinata TaxID=191078 RepID=UPI002A7FE12B|nr:putative nuclease HARBI1 [Saccostrea echinata]
MAAVVGFLRRVQGGNVDTVRRRRRLPRPRLFRDRLNPLDLRTDDELFERYRFRRPTIMFIYDTIQDRITHPTKRSLALPAMIQLLVFLQFVATGAFHQLVGDAIHISKATAGRCIRRVASAIANVAGRFIRFPSGQDATNVKRMFHAIAGFPGVLGCVDGTFIRIQTPTENEPDYVNRKGYHSLNVMMTCDANFMVTNCVAKWPGSCHDSRVFRESVLCQQFENGQHNGILLGDSGYPCRTYLMTPYNNTNDVRYRERYNSALCRTRVLIEQTYGILKRRFPCLSIGLRTSPERACQYVITCVVLHNIGILRQDIVSLDPRDLIIAGPDVDEINHGNNNGFGYRELIARQCFDY